MMSKRKSERLLGVTDLVKRGIAPTRRTVYSWQFRGVLPPPMRIGRRILWRESEIDDWLESRRVG